MWLAGVEYAPASEVERARMAGRDEGLQRMRVAFGVTWALLFVVLLFLSTASGAYPAGPCGTG